MKIESQDIPLIAQELLDEFTETGVQPSNEKLKELTSAILDRNPWPRSELIEGVEELAEQAGKGIVDTGRMEEVLQDIVMTEF